MSHIFFFITVSIIVFSVIPLVILLSSVQYLHGVKPLVKRMSLFLVIFVAEAISNMILFYNEEVVDINITKLFYRFGWYYLYALVLFGWLPMFKYLCKNKFVTVIDKLNHYFLIIYTTAWIFSATLAPEHFWSVITMCDKVQITFSLLGILSCIYSFVKKEKEDMVSVFYALTVFLFNLLSFYWKEDPLLLKENLYLFSWIGIAFATLAYIIYVVKREKSKSVSCAQEKIIDIDGAYRKLREAYGLTKREEDILREIYSGKSNQQIASDLCISEATVKAHIHNLLGKMSVGSRVEAIVVVQKEIYL